MYFRKNRPESFLGLSVDSTFASYSSTVVHRLPALRGFAPTPVVENCEPNFRFGSKAEIRSSRLNDASAPFSGTYHPSSNCCMLMYLGLATDWLYLPRHVIDLGALFHLQQLAVVLIRRVGDGGFRDLEAHAVRREQGIDCIHLLFFEGRSDYDTLKTKILRMKNCIIDNNFVELTR